MALTKRLRFEILRRDNHACRYCGATAPDTKLTVDHVIPVALGGTYDPSNLVAACAPCNSGKSSTSPNAPIVRDVDTRATAWAAAMQQAAEERLAVQETRAQLHDYFRGIWDNWGWYDHEANRHLYELDSDWKTSIDQFYAAGLMAFDFQELVETAMACKTASDKWRYFCGCCWRRIREAQERATEIATEWEATIRGA